MIHKEARVGGGGECVGVRIVEERGHISKQICGDWSGSTNLSDILSCDDGSSSEQLNWTRHTTGHLHTAW